MNGCDADSFVAIRVIGFVEYSGDAEGTPTNRKCSRTISWVQALLLLRKKRIYYFFFPVATISSSHPFEKHGKCSDSVFHSEKCIDRVSLLSGRRVSDGLVSNDGFERQVAMEAADMVLVSSDVCDVVAALHLGRKVYILRHILCGVSQTWHVMCKL